jgi:hypothetical protein
VRITTLPGIRKAKGVQKGDKEHKKKMHMKMSFSRQEMIARQLKRGVLSGVVVGAQHDDDFLPPAHVSFPIAVGDGENHSDVCGVNNESIRF